MKRTAYIARTSHDLDHVNRITVPTFSILELRLKAGAKTSKSYLPDGSPPPKTAEAGSDNFHFVPEKETIEIKYEIDDRAGLVTGAKLELFTRFEEDALWTLDFDKLGADWWAHGTHVIKWDGRIVKPTAEQKGTEKDGGLEHDLTTVALDKSLENFPDGYTTLEFPPYKFRMTLASKDWPKFGFPIFAWTYWHILIKSIELDLGPEEAIPAVGVDDDEHKRNKAVRTKMDTDGKVPADGSTRKVMLISNIFKTASAEMGTNSAYSEYKTMWEDGPLIPIVAKIRLKDSADAEVKLDESDKGAVALGNVKFLWDWEDPAEDTATQVPSATAKTFVDDAINYDKDATDESPKGDNCHLDRGGKRGVGAKVIFPKQAGYKAKDTLDAGKFPFKVELDPLIEKRKWAALSSAWSSGKMKGKTGVVFQPSRMGGDDYVLTVYLANDRAKKDKLVLDVTDEPLKANSDIKKKSGKFQIWRELHLSKYVRKKNAIADFVAASLGGFRGNYNAGYVEIEDKTVKSELPTAGYDGLAKARIGTVADAVVTHAVDPAADHSTTASAFLVRDHNAFKAAVRAQLAIDQPALNPGQLDTARDTWLTTKQVETPVKYSDKLDSLLRMAAKKLTGDLNTLTGAADGITIVHFDFVCSVRSGLAGSSGILGSAIDVPGATRNKCCFVLFVSAVDTFVHEIGHHLFLAHFGPSPDDFDAVFHDQLDTACIMTYNRPRPHFCGYCMLRLRGWNGSVMNPDGTQNKHP